MAEMVTFLFTDIEGSTRLWETAPVAMQAALKRHDAILRDAIESAGGTVFKTVGDAFCAVFADPAAAIEAASGIVARLGEQAWETPSPLRVRVALHSGPAQERDDDYFGQSVNRVARVLSAAHGGQTLVSSATRALLRAFLPDALALRPLGSHGLRDLALPEDLFQLDRADTPTHFPPLRTLSHPDIRHNLPVQMTSFIGREREMHEIRAALTGTRLLTLTGSGGAGKTRLALQVAADLIDGAGDGIWFVELAALADGAGVAPEVAAALGVTEIAGEPIVQTLVSWLRPRRLLLVLDNCEHVLDASAQLADTILKRCPFVTLLASSREALNVAGETTYRVPSLSLPEIGRERVRVSDITGYESVRLFVERAVAGRPDFAVTVANAPAVVQLCRQLDGIPLALELAAARVKALSVEEINNRLDQRFRLLTGGSRTALPRQQTLRSLIDWSFDLLNAAEKALLCRLSVFSGGWTLESAEAIGPGDGVDEFEVLDALIGLVDKSLAVADTQSDPPRYRLLETVRQYARDRWMDRSTPEGIGECRAKHLAHFAALLEASDPGLRGPELPGWLSRLDNEHENLRAALRFGVETAHENPAHAIDAARLCGATERFWTLRGHLREGRDWCAQILRLPAELPDAVRARVLCAAGVLAARQGDSAAARPLLEDALVHACQSQNPERIASALNGLGFVTFLLGDYEESRTFWDQSLEIWKGLDNAGWVAGTLGNLGTVAEQLGDAAGARRYYDEVIALARRLGNRDLLARTLINLGLNYANAGDLPAARAALDESVDVCRALDFRPLLARALANLGDILACLNDFAPARVVLDESLRLSQELGIEDVVVEALEPMGSVMLAEGNPHGAAQILAASDALRLQLDIPREPAAQTQFRRYRAQVLAALGADDFARADTEGRKLTRDAAIELALEKRRGIVGAPGIVMAGDRDDVECNADPF